MEKNSKARQYILNGLGREDMDKVIHIDNAKDMWAALKAMHEGSDELKAARKFQLQTEYHSFSMGEKESISEYYARFQRLASKLTNSGVTLEDASKALVIVNGLSEKFALIKGILRNTPGALDIGLPQIIGKLTVDEGEITKASQAKEIEKGVALKIEAGISKAFSRLEVENDDSEGEQEDDDEMTVLFTKHIKRQFTKRRFKPSFVKKDPKDMTCFSCNQKGHMARNCPNASDDEKAEGREHKESKFSRNKFDKKKKALVAAWGSGSESEGDADGNTQSHGRCLMAKETTSESPKGTSSESSPEVVIGSKLLKKLHASDKQTLINIITEYVETTESQLVKIEDFEDTISCMVEENILWANKVERLETELVEAKNSLKETEDIHAQCSKLCTSCKGKSILEDFEPQSTQNMLDNILCKIDDLTFAINDKTVNQTVFVRPRYGLGYRGPVEEESEEQVEFNKIRDEMAQRNENLSLALQTSKERTTFLEQKVRVLEVNSVQNKHQNSPTSTPKSSQGSTPKEKKWFDGQPAHKMYVKQAKGKGTEQVDLVKQKNKQPFRPGKGKYGHVLNNRVCWHCGQNGHVIRDCQKKKDLRASKAKEQASIPKDLLKRSKDEKSKASCSDKSLHASKPVVPITCKPKSNWVPKA